MPSGTTTSRMSMTSPPSARGTRRTASAPLLEQLQHLLRRPRDERVGAAEDDRALHQLRVPQEQLDDGLASDVVLGTQAELREALVLAHEVRGRVGDGGQDTLDIRTTDRR